MAKISTGQKGDILEKKAFELLNEIISNNEFFVNGKNSKIFQKKSYYSEKRKSKIIFDITVETYLNNSNDYALLTIFECKNLNRKVSIDDVEEFDSKIRQIGENNTKGIIISSTLFQEGAYNFAKSQGIGLVRVTTENQLDWINYRKNIEQLFYDYQKVLELFTEDFALDNNFIASINNRKFNNMADVLLEARIIDSYKHKEKYIKIPYLSDSEICDKIIPLSESDIYTSKYVDTIKLCKIVSNLYSTEFDFRAILPNNVIGKIEFENNKISMSQFSGDENKWRFTLAHEIGHLVLHSSLLKGRIDSKSDNDYSLSLDYNISDTSNRKLEYQANTFASHLLLPTISLMQIVDKYFADQRINKGYLYWDHQSVNYELVMTLLNKISFEMKVSKTVARIRLQKLGLLVDERFKSVGSILTNQRNSWIDSH